MKEVSNMDFVAAVMAKYVVDQFGGILVFSNVFRLRNYLIDFIGPLALLRLK
jgi:hypothetical protein